MLYIKLTLSNTILTGFHSVGAVFVTAPNTKKKELFVNTLKKNLKFTVLLLVSLMIVLGVPVLGYAEITAVSDRTAEVRDAIVTAAGVNTADEVTETHLAAITSLNYVPLALQH